MAKEQVIIAREEYTLSGDAACEHLRAVAAYVDERLIEAQNVAKGLSDYKAAVLTAVNIADELLRAREDIERLNNSIELLQRENSLLKARTAPAQAAEGSDQGSA